MRRNRMRRWKKRKVCTGLLVKSGSNGPKGVRHDKRYHQPSRHYGRNIENRNQGMKNSYSCKHQYSNREINISKTDTEEIVDAVPFEKSSDHLTNYWYYHSLRKRKTLGYKSTGEVQNWLSWLELSLTEHKLNVMHTILLLYFQPVQSNVMK